MVYEWGKSRVSSQQLIKYSSPIGNYPHTYSLAIIFHVEWIIKPTLQAMITSSVGLVFIPITWFMSI